MKIIVIGAGHGGLQAAKVLAKNGHEVTVYEKSPRDSVSYDWRDDVEPTVFEELNIPVPENSYRTNCVSLVAPFSETPLYVYSEEHTREWNLDRKTFVLMLCDLAEKEGAKIYFESPVEKLIVENNEVKGVYVNNEKIYADLVIDSSGLNSPFRAEVSDLFGITKQINDDEAFTVYRAFVKPNENAERPEKYKKKIYLKHLGQPGISWCVCEPDGLINILVGRIGRMSDEEFNRSLTELKRTNPIIGYEVVRGGQIARIPVRYPLTKMVGKGYAVLGDAAFMTIPLIGSGMANSLRAGQMLAEEIINANSVCVDTLWKYQVRYYKEIGAGHYMVDCLKRMLLNAKNEDIKYMFECGVITEDDMRCISCGEPLKLTPKAVVQKVGKGIKKSNFLISLVGAALKGIRAEKTAKQIPTNYNEEEIKQWQNKVEKMFS